MKDTLVGYIPLERVVPGINPVILAVGKVRGGFLIERGLCAKREQILKKRERERNKLEKITLHSVVRDFTLPS